MYLQVPFVLYLSVLIFPCYISATLLVSTQLGSIRAIIKELSYPTVRNIIINNYYTGDEDGMTLEGQVRRICTSFGRAKQDLRRVVSSWES